MLPMVKTFILIILLLLFSRTSSGGPNGITDGIMLTNPRTEVLTRMTVRKLMGSYTLSDYGTGPNTSHNQGPGKGPKSGGK